MTRLAPAHLEVLEDISETYGYPLEKLIRLADAGEIEVGFDEAGDPRIVWDRFHQQTGGGD